MLGPDALEAVVEVGEVAGLHIDRTDAEARGAGVDPVEVHQPFQRRLQGRGVIEAEGFRGALRVGQGGRHPGPEHARRTEDSRPGGVELVHQGADPVAQPGRRQGRPGGHRLPELAQPLHASFGGISRDDRRIDRADGYAGQPGRLHVRLDEALVNPGLIGAERAAALQHQDSAGRTDIVEGHERNALGQTPSIFVAAHNMQALCQVDEGGGFGRAPQTTRPSPVRRQERAGSKSVWVVQV